MEGLTRTFAEHEIDPAVIYLYSVLPYIESDDASEKDFLHGGQFTDFRDEEEVELGRDPYYISPEDPGFDDEDGPYMRPWVTPLSRLGNHGSVIIYDAMEHKIWILDQIDWWTTDPALEGVPRAVSTSRNRNNFDHVPSRPAFEVLEDIRRWYHTLEVLPGQGELSYLEWNDPEMNLASIYRKNGWPDNFDGDGFLVDQARKYCTLRARYFAEEPLRIRENFLKSFKSCEEERIRLRDRVAAAQSADDLWLAQFQLSVQEISIVDQAEGVAQVQQDCERLCPNGECQQEEDLPLWELEMIKLEYGTEPSNDIHRRAYEASLADAERLRPGETLASVTAHGLHYRSPITDDWVSQIRMKRLVHAREFLLKIPETAVKAREFVQAEIRKFEGVLASST